MVPTLERDQKPLYVVRWSPDPELADVRAHFEQVLDVLAIHRTIHRAAFVHDMRQLGVPSAAFRREAASALTRHFAEYEDTVAGVAHVASNPLVAGAVTALYWLAPPPFPTHSTTDYEQALRWARQQLAQPPPA